MGPLLAFAYEYNYFETVGYTVAGGMAGVIMISFFSQWLLAGWSWFKENKHRLFNLSSTQLIPLTRSKKAKKMVFSRRNRKIVKYWNKFGLMGIALVTPVFISIPIGTFIATKYV